MNDFFRRFAHACAIGVGSSRVFLLAIGVIIAWALTGPLFHFSDTWQLVVNTGTSVITFLMVFLIQNTQNRDARAMQLKLDELLRAVHGARTRLVDLEDLSDEELAHLQLEFQTLRERLQQRTERARSTGGAADQTPKRRLEDHMGV